MLLLIPLLQMLLVQANSLPGLPEPETLSAMITATGSLVIAKMIHVASGEMKEIRAVWNSVWK